jgi:hypothetical protein
MKKNIETTEVINVTITNTVEGDTSEKFTKEYRSKLAKEIKSKLGVDDVSVESVKTFVMEKSDTDIFDPTDPKAGASLLLDIWIQSYQKFIAAGFSEHYAVVSANNFFQKLMELSK